MLEQQTFTDSKGVKWLNRPGPAWGGAELSAGGHRIPRIFTVLRRCLAGQRRHWVCGVVGGAHPHLVWGRIRGQSVFFGVSNLSEVPTNEI